MSDNNKDSNIKSIGASVYEQNLYERMEEVTKLAKEGTLLNLLLADDENTNLEK